jgi:hypothetical protein
VDRGGGFWRESSGGWARGIDRGLYRELYRGLARELERVFGCNRAPG